MKRILAAIWLLAVVSVPGLATTYYVSSSAGNDSNAGTSVAAPWQTLAKVNGRSFAAGDKILLRRGDTWREPLVPPSSGTSASSIYFDAYGSGPAPVITAYQDIPAGSWSLVSGNVWQAPLSATALNNVHFGTIWGQKQTSQGAVLHDRDFYFSGTAVYVFSSGNPATYYGSVAAIFPFGGQLIYVNGKSWLEFQHIALHWFEGFGVNVSGSSDHLLFANMEAYGMVPAGTLPHGFYVNASSPADIQFYNDEAHLNYDGFRFDGSSTAITLVNCKAYANRDGGLVDNTGHATYSYSHFYANNIATFNSQNVQGGAIDGGHNIQADTWPAVSNFATYPARITFTVDDMGFSAGTENYIDSLLPEFNSRSLKLSIAVVAGYSSGFQSNIAGWLAAGHDINSHSWSHQYYTNTNSFTIRYTGTGTAATLTISGSRLTTSVSGGPGGENLDLDLTSPSYDTISELVTAINTHGGYSASLDPNCRTAAHSIGLADVSSHDVKSAYTAVFQKDRLEPDELTTSKNWLQANIGGLSNVKVFVYPSGIQDTQTQGWAAAAGYLGARGALSIGLGSNAIYSKGVNIQNVTSLGVGGLHGMSAQAIEAGINALVFKAAVWGVPYGLFVHRDDLTPPEVALVLDYLLARGAVVLTNTQLIDWLASTTNITGTTNYVSPAPGAAPDFTHTPASPVLNTGSNLGAVYALDMTGTARPTTGPWDVGAYEHSLAAYGTGSGPGSFTIGGNGGPPDYPAAMKCQGSLADPGCAIVQYPAVPPQMGCDTNLPAASCPNHCSAGSLTSCNLRYGANTVFTDPDLSHARIARVTDAYTGGTNKVHDASFKGGSDPGVWAIDESGFVINEEGNNQQLWWFDATTMYSGRMYSGTVPNGQFSYVDRNTYWALTSTKTLDKYDLTGHAYWDGAQIVPSNPSSPVVTTIFDWKKCIPAGQTINWNSIGYVDTRDHWFAMGVSFHGLGQNGDGKVLAYDRVGNECFLYDSIGDLDSGAISVSVSNLAVDATGTVVSITTSANALGVGQVVFFYQFSGGSPASTFMNGNAITITSKPDSTHIVGTFNGYTYKVGGAPSAYGPAAVTGTGVGNLAPKVYKYTCNAPCTDPPTATWTQTTLGAPTASDQFGVHNVITTKNIGNYANPNVAIMSGGCILESCPTASAAMYMWAMGTTTVVGQTNNYGHWTPGDKVLNVPGYGLTGASFQREITNLANGVGVGYPYPDLCPASNPVPPCTSRAVGRHQDDAMNNPTFLARWGMAADTVPIIWANAVSNNPATFLGPFWDEMIGSKTCDPTVPASCNGPYPIWRFGHLFNTGVSWHFAGQWALGPTSPGGHFHLFTSDGQGTLGRHDGAAGACNLSSDAAGDGCRDEVFVMELK